MAITDASRLANFASNVGTGVTFAGNDILVAGVVTATSFVGDGSNITNAGSTLSAGSGDQRVVVTSLTSGTMTSAGTDADLTWNSSTNTLSTGIVSATTLSGNITGTAATFTGNVTGTSATFTGNVTIGGTLTYEDVTNVDSVGIITAQSGIRVGSGESISPVSGTLTYYGDGSNLTGVEAGSANFVASGTIANGATVVINTDGTVGIVTQTGSAASVGSEVVFESGTTNYTGAVYDPDTGKVIIAYVDGGNSSHGTAIVGTVSGTSISFGTAVVFESATTAYTSVACVGTSKVVITYRDEGNSNYGTAIVGTVSGTDISFGSATVFESAATLYTSVCALATSGKVVVAYQDDGNSNHGTAIVGTVSGTSISFGSAVVFSAETTMYMSPTYDSTNDRVVITYQKSGSNDYGTSIVGTVSGTSISFGTAVVFASAVTSYISAVYDSTNGKIVIAYQDGGNSSYGTAIVGTVSGTSISFGTEVVFESGESDHISPTYDSTNGKIVIAYRDGDNSNYGTVIGGTVSGTSISFDDSPILYNAGNSYYISSAYDSTNGKVVITYNDASNIYKGTSVVYSPNTISTNLTTENYIGIAGEAIANAATGKINIVGGVNSGQSGLTTAKTYYVGKTGILTTTADNPSVVAGTSISDTKIKVRL